ncbi:hypothetical protein [Pseudoalteromonas phage PH357]|nr:hypothetical protein [Pseudoalteromonas phage PH357]
MRYYIPYPTYILHEKLVDRLINICEDKLCDYVSCYLETLENGGKWCFVLSTEPVSNSEITVWEFKDIRKDDLKEYMFLEGHIK